MGAAPPARTCEPLRVMSYNIRLDLESDGINGWSNRREQFVGQVRLIQPAILGLQEVVPGQKADLEQALPGYAFIGVARDDGRNKGEYSNLAIDRTIFRIQSSGTFWLSPTPKVPSKGWDAAFPRIATWAKLVRRNDGRRFLALNTHFDHVGQTARLESARQIVRWIGANRSPGETVLVTGDLNAEPGTPPLIELTGGKLGLRDAKAASKTPPVGPEGTFNNWVLVPPETRRIDYVLADRSVEVERYAVLAWHGEGGRPASDHFAVVADVKACRK
ncbi:MAG TPA: endonuclease/exonuclease/phosphatase family protein [Sphingomicrobium sp.]|nr:endonuclease/exonuclease/phosphatase family protein [Sphingomicrobium sp.]